MKVFIPTEVTQVEQTPRIQSRATSVNYDSNPMLTMVKNGFLGIVVLCIIWYFFIVLSGVKMAVEWVGFSPAKGQAIASTNKTEIAPGDAAPIDLNQLNQYDPKGYIEKYRETAIQEMKKYGVPASISLAQGLVESRAGTSGIARKCNNHFGIKCFSNHHKGCCMKFKDDSNADSFKIWEKSAWGSWRAHSVLLSSGRYKELHQYGTDYRKWAYGLKAAGYATDKTYAEKLINVIEAYNLQQYDQNF